MTKGIASGLWRGFLHTTATTVFRVVKRFLELQTFHRKPGSRRPRCTSARDDCFLMLQILRERHLTAVQARNRLIEVRQVHVSENTARRRLKEDGLTARRPATGPELYPQHRRARLQFAQQHHHWTQVEWSRVLFTDESRFFRWKAESV